MLLSMDSSQINDTRSSLKFTQVMSSPVTLSVGAIGVNRESSGLRTSPKYACSNQIHRVSLVKLTPLEQNTTLATSSPLSPNTLTRLVEEQARSHEAIEALQKRIQADTSNSFTSDARKELEQSALTQRNFLNQVLSTPSSVTTLTTCTTTPDDQPVMLQFPSYASSNSTPLTKKLFPDVSRDVTQTNRVPRELNHSPESDYGVEPAKHGTKSGSSRRNKRSDTDNDTGVESDSGSDTAMDTRSEKDFSTIGKSTPFRLRSMGTDKSDRDELLVYLEAIEQRALEVEGLIEKAKLETVVNIRHRLEAEFEGVQLEDIPSKCHEKIDRAIQRYLQHELENIRAEYESKESGNEVRAEGERLGRARTLERRDEDLERENSDLKEKVESLEKSVERVDMLYLMQKKENQYLTEKLAKLDRQMANEKLMYENELDDVRNGLVEDIEMGNSSFKEHPEGDGARKGGMGTMENSQKITLLYERLEQEEKQKLALKVAGQADQTTIRCLTEKTRDMEGQLKSSREEVSELLREIHELQERDDVREKKFKQCEVKLKEVLNERRLLRETLIMSEHEISLLENKLGDENTSAWKESKQEILEELRKLEKHIKIIHKEKRKLENKYLAFKIENENLSDSLNSFVRTKDILTPMGSCDVSRRESNLSSHSSSLSSSLAGSDVEDEGTHSSRYGNKNRSLHSQSGRRRRRGQDHKDKQFAEAVAKKLLFAQKAIKDQNCNFSSFENSGQDLVNETDELVKRVDSLQAEKLAIKMELESIRSAPTENVKC